MASLVGGARLRLARGLLALNAAKLDSGGDGYSGVHDTLVYE